MRIQLSLIYIFMLSYVCQAQEIDWRKTYKLRFVNNKMVAEKKVTADSILIHRLGKRNFDQWFKDITPSELSFIKEETVGLGPNCDGCPFGLPSTQKIEVFHSFHLTYRFEVPSIGNFYINHDQLKTFPSIQKYKKTGDLIAKIRRQYFKNGHRVVQAVSYNIR
ncbi:MAG: hypothetical protein GY810_30330 [Aureispira sp.]|nr:hypothetical protein [Aureispira sp.]